MSAIYSQKVQGFKDTIEKSDTNTLIFHNNTLAQRIAKGNSNIQVLDEQIEKDKKEIIVLNDVKKLLVRLKNAKVVEKKDFILNTINLALADVFHDLKLTIDIVAAATNESSASQINLKYDVVLKRNGVEMAKNEKLINDGGGILAFISILFKVLVGFIHSKNRFYIFDESLAEVSVVYLPRLAKFLRKFCEKHSFTIVMVTHEIEIMAREANLVYRVEGEETDGIPTLKIDKVEGEVPEKDYIYANIENFQSIKKAHFRYYGLTLITGPNGIGKSASFRAINSLLFNTFDTKSYPRMSSSQNPEKRLNSKITFGRVGPDGKEDETRKITLKKKGQGIVYEFDNKEFVGKMLAFDKVKEKIESIGFSYLKLKDSYKNFKGNMKEQTERLAVTTQQDGYYIVGAKTNETSKIFDFLFDSRDVTLAIAQVSDDIQVLNRKIEDTNIQINNFKNDLKLDHVLQKIINKWYQVKLIYEINDKSSEAGFLGRTLNIYNKKKELLDKGCHIINTVDNIKFKEIEIDHIKQDMGSLTKQQTLLTKIIDLRQKKKIIDFINGSAAEVNVYKQLDIKLKKKQEIFTKLIGLQTKATLAYNTICTNNLFNQLNLKVISLKKRVSILTGILHMSWSQALIETIQIKTDNLEASKKENKKLVSKQAIITKLIENYRMQDSMRNHINLVNDKQVFLDTYKKYLYRLGLINKECNLQIQKFQILSWQDKVKQTYEYKQELEKIINGAKAQIDGLGDKYNLCECGTCHGLGMTNIK